VLWVLKPVKQNYVEMVFSIMVFENIDKIEELIPKKDRHEKNRVERRLVTFFGGETKKMTVDSQLNFL